MPIALQAELVIRRYDDAVLRQDWRSGRVTCLVKLRPAEYSDTYEVVFDHIPSKSPIVYVARPHLELIEGKPLPHVYPLNTLCLYWVGNWNVSLPIAHSLMPWASEWLLYYEVWLATGGTWLGDGIHPAPTGSHKVDTDHRQKDITAEREAKLVRLRSALIATYGQDGDVADLLYNATL